jgi:hypothetical protein
VLTLARYLASNPNKIHLFFFPRSLQGNSKTKKCKERTKFEKVENLKPRKIN